MELSQLAELYEAMQMPVRFGPIDRYDWKTKKFHKLKNDNVAKKKQMADLEKAVKQILAGKIKPVGPVQLPLEEVNVPE